MSIYTFRPGTPTLKKVLIRSATKFFCFDKGHLRITGSIPPEFVAVPEQVILEFFGTKYTLNIRKLERAIEDYDKGMVTRQGQPRPKRLRFDRCTWRHPVISNCTSDLSNRSTVKSSSKFFWSLKYRGEAVTGKVK